MTVPINIPIITTSPPTVKSVKQMMKPENSLDFEQILKQKTSESSQADSGIQQNDPAVKIKPQNNIESEVKSIKDDTKSEKVVEESKSSIKAEESSQPSIEDQLTPTIVLPQTVPVLALNSTPVDETKKEQSPDVAVDLMEEGEKGSATPGGTAADLIQFAKSSMTEVTGSTSVRLGKTVSMLHPEGVDQGVNKEIKDANGIDRSMQSLEADPSVSEPKLDSAFAQKLSSTQNLNKADEQNKATVGNASIDAGKGTNSNQNSQSPATDLGLEMFKTEYASVPGQSALADEKGITTSVKVVQEPDVKVNTPPQSEGQQAVVSSANKVQTDEIKVVTGVKNLGTTVKTDRKMVTEAPPDSPDKAPPETTPEVVTDRLKADPFTGKINEPARLAEAQSTEILRQIGRQVAGSSNSGSQTIRIQLHPEDLGQIELRITSSSQGTHVSLMADQSGTSKLLETHIAQLKQTLSDAGVQMADVHVGQQAPQQSFRDPQSRHNSLQNNSRYDNRTVAGSDEIVSNRSQLNSSLVDYRI